MTNSQLKPPAFKSGAMPDMSHAALIAVRLNSHADYKGHGKGSPVQVGYGMQVLRGGLDEPRARQVQLRCTLGNNQPPQDIPYSGMLHVMGQFRFKDDVELDEDEMDQRAAWTAANILVGMIRSHIQVLTAVGPYPPIVLGPVVIARILGKATVIERGSVSPRAMYPDLLNLPSEGQPKFSVEVKSKAIAQSKELDRIRQKAQRPASRPISANAKKKPST